MASRLGMFVLLASWLWQAWCVKVELVHLSSGTQVVTSTPVRVLCDVTTEPGEEVLEVAWRHHGNLVYLWTRNSTIHVYGVLEDRVEIPSNKSDWNIKVTRLSLKLQGSLECSVTSNLNHTASDSFDFIAYYASNMDRKIHSDVTTCTVTASIFWLEVYPRPIIICSMRHEQQGFLKQLRGTDTVNVTSNDLYTYQYNVSVQFTEYPVGSFMRCHKYVYGDEIEVLKWTPTEDVTCISPLPAAYEGYVLHKVEGKSGCRGGYKVGARAIYVCHQYREPRDVETTCQGDRQWSPDLTLEQSWLTCAGSVVIFTSWLLLALTLLLVNL